MSRIYAGLLVLLFVGIISGVAFYKGYKLGEKLVYAEWDKARIEATKATAKENIQIVKDRKKAVHENQNRDRDALILNGCKRGWLRDFEKCPAGIRKTGPVRDSVLPHGRYDRNNASGINE